MVADVLLPIGAYVVGSVPSGYLLVRAFRGRDVRQYGSHNVGAINVFRVGGAKLGAATLLTDVGKAVLVVLIAAAITDRPSLIAAAALAVLLGHAFSIWFLLKERRFSEGKSVASGLGALLGLVIAGKLPWPVAATPLGVWAAGLLLPRLLTGRWWWISPATMAATLAIPVVVCATHPAAPYQLLALLMSALILLRHRNNIRRLIAGMEPKLGEAPTSA
jgi:glycerol-3-phosphate acyltransferase PlsY